jgi:PAS domain S-box-containing protein
MSVNPYQKIVLLSPFGYAYHKIILDKKGKPIDYKFIEVNKAFENFTGLKAKEIINKKITQVIPDIVKDEFDWIGFYGDIAINGGEKEFVQYSSALQKYYRVYVYSPKKYFFITNFFEIDEEKIEYITDKEQDKKLILINEYSYNLANITLDEVPNYIINGIKNIFNIKTIILIEFDAENSQLFIKKTNLNNKEILNLKNKLKIRVNDLRIKLSQKEYNLLVNERYKKYSSFNSLTFGLISKEQSDSIKKILDIKWIVSLSIIVSEKLYGTIVLIGDSNSILPPKSFLLAFSSITSNAISKKLSELQLTIEEKRFKEIFNLITDAILVIDINSKKIIQYNDSLLNLLGYNKTELINKTIYDLKLFDEKAKYDALVTKSKFIRKYDDLLKKKNGESFWAEVSIKYTRMLNNDIGIITLKDISNRKNTEEILINKEKLAKRKSEIISSLLLDKEINSGNLQKAKQTLTEKATELFNVERASIWLLSDDNKKLICIDLYEKSKNKHSSGQELLASKYPKYFNAIRKNSKVIANNAQTDNITIEFRDDYLIPNEITSMLDSVIFGIDNMIGVFSLEHIGEIRSWEYEEVTLLSTLSALVERIISIEFTKKTEEILIKNEEKYRLMTNNISDVIMILNKDGIVTYTTTNIEKWFGWSPEDLMNKKIWNFIHRSDLDYVKNYFSSAFEKLHNSITLELQFRCKDNNYKYIEVTATNFIDNELIDGLLVNFRDVSDRKFYENKIIEDQRRLQDIIDFFPDAVLGIDNNKRVIIWNKEIERMTGIPAKDMIGKGDYAYTVPFYGYPRPQLMDLFFEDSIEIEEKYPFVKREGNTLITEVFCNALYNNRGAWLAAKSTPLFDKNGNIIGVIESLRDLTQKKREELEREVIYKIGELSLADINFDDLLTKIYENINKVIYAKNCYVALYDEDSDIVSFPFFMDLFDPKPEPRKKRKGLTEYVINTSKPLLLTEEILDNLLKDGEIEIIGTPPVSWLGVPLQIQLKTIGVLVIQSYNQNIRYEEKDKNLMSLIANQVALVIERKRNYDLIIKNKYRLEKAQEIGLIGNWELDLQTKKIWGSKQAQMIYGFSNIEGELPLELVQKSALPEYRKMLDDALYELVVNGREYNVEFKIRRPDNSIRFIYSKAERILDSNGNPTHVLGVIQDITERKELEDLIISEKEQLLVTLRSIGDGVITTDIRGNIVIMNRVAEELTGWTLDEAFGKPLEEVFNIINELTRKKCENPVTRVLQTKSIVELENHTLLVSRNGQERIIADSGAPIMNRESNIIGVVLVFRDMTEKQKLIENAQRTDKLNSLGVLAGGIAHDFNNMLTGIFGFVDIARLKNKDPKIDSYLNGALKVFSRAKNLTQQLLTFSKGGAPRRKTSSLKNVLIDNINFALSGSKIGKDIKIQDDLWLCDFDENQIAQVIDNLIINAQQAMPDGGNITIIAENVFIDKNINPIIKEGPYVKISFSDTGIGIPPEIMKKIFDPFFTTKQQGNGLGLSIVYSIIQKHDGYIDVKSEVGKGTTFTIFLPASYENDTIELLEYQNKHKGSGKVLIMDDEIFIRNIFKEIMVEMGYTVFEASNGQEAIEKIDELMKESEPLKLVFLDLTIPGGIGGKEVINKVQPKYPDIKFIACSGYSEDPVISNPKEFGFSASVSKPFLEKDLNNLLLRLFPEK